MPDGFGAAELLGWTPVALDAIGELRGWTEQAIERLELAYLADEHRIGIPVRDEHGDEHGELRYDPTGEHEPKMLASAGTPRALLPPPETIADEELDEHHTVWLVEGEPDAIRMWSLGLPAVAVPGAQNWRDEWAARLVGRRWRIIVCFDCDQAGRAGAGGAAAAIVQAGGDARLVDLDPERDDGYDLTDFTRAATTVDLRLGAARLLTAIANGVELYRPEQGERLLFPYHELRAQHEQEDTTDWIWSQLVAPGYLTRIDGRPKVAGKSTLLFALCAAIRNGLPFLGLETRTATVAYCSEQRWQTLHQKLILPFGAPPYMHLYHDEPLDLSELIPRLLDETEQLGVELVIIDTVGKWLRLSQGGRFDPDVMAAHMSLLEQLSQRVGVVVADYTRKGDSPRGEGTLGATEQTGRADILIELKRPDSEQPTVRRLEITGRSDAPEEIDYTMNGDGVLERCNLDDLQLASEGQAILSLLRAIDRDGQPAPSGSAIAKQLGKRKATVLEQLGSLRDQGRVYSLGAGAAQVWALQSNPRTDPGTDREPVAGTTGTDHSEEFGGLF